MIELLQNGTIDGVVIALAHSLWQGLLACAILVMLDSSGLFKTAHEKYLAHLYTMLSIPLFTIITMVILFAPATGATHMTTTSALPQITMEQSGLDGGIRSISWQSLAFITWILGACLLATRNISAGLRLFGIRQRAESPSSHWTSVMKRQAVKMGLRRKVTLLSCRETRVPFVIGVFRPAIVFPANFFLSLTPAQVESILIHELGHIQRNDFLLNLVQLVVESLYFFNPATWWLGSRIRLYREHCCDDLVQSHVDNKRTYLEALYQVACAATGEAPVGVTLFQNNSELIMRIKRMSNKQKPAQSVRSLVMAGLTILSIAGALAFTTFSDESTETQPMDSIQLELQSKFDLAARAQLAELEIEPVAVIEVQERLRARVSTSLNQQLPELMVADTHPPTPRMLELQAQMEQLAEEMEELADEMEEAMEDGIEEKVEEIETLAEQIEEIYEKYEDEIEGSLENSQEMQRIEELSEQLSERMESIEDEIEEHLDEELIERLEEQIESKAEQYENYKDLTDAEKEQLQREMQVLQEELQEAMADFQINYTEIMADEEMKAIQAEMAQLSEELGRNQQVAIEPFNQEVAELQAEMAQLQAELQEEMNAAMNELQQELREKTVEMEQLSRELQEETRKWEAEHHKRNE